MEEDKSVGEEVKLACLECDTETYHKVLKSISDSENVDWGFFWRRYEIVMCLGCHTLSFRKTWGSDDQIGYNEDGEPQFDESEDLFPSRVKGRKELTYRYMLPSEVQKIYKETHMAASGKQPILAGLGIRTIVETVCREKKAKGHDLKDKIEDLVSIGVLTKEGAQILHHARIYGNDAAHETLEVKEEDLNILMDIVENLLENTFILPQKAEKLRKAAEKKVKQDWDII